MITQWEEISAISIQVCEMENNDILGTDEFSTSVKKLAIEKIKLLINQLETGNI